MYGVLVVVFIHEPLSLKSYFHCKHSIVFTIIQIAVSLYTLTFLCEEI